MIRISDLMTPAPVVARSLAPPAAQRTAPSPASWFDAEAPGAGVRIRCDMGAATRGLSVAQHAERVLAPLCEPDGPA